MMESGLVMEDIAFHLAIMDWANKAGDASPRFNTFIQTIIPKIDGSFVYQTVL